MTAHDVIMTELLRLLLPILRQGDVYMNLTPHTPTHTFILLQNLLWETCYFSRSQVPA
jgi:hypothetical protein